MKDKDSNLPEAIRLENLWSGRFGDDYVDRNRGAGEVRQSFWKKILSDLDVQTLLEVGCNTGANMKWISTIVPPQNVFGIDINLKALNELRKTLPDINAVWSPGRDLPFRDGWFDFVFTMGVLIHQPESTLPLVMSEVVRCSNRYVLCGEYFSEQTTEVPYRGQCGALFKRDYGRIYLELFPNLSLVENGFLSREEGWDDVTFWLFKKY